MLINEIILKKRHNKILTNEEISFFVNEYSQGKIADYQMSALLMAIVLNGMNKEETLSLTKAMMNSGDIIDLSLIKGVKVDKHSTGGVGDKTTLVLAPLVASCGVSVAKMSGRGLGHTGGTIDKMESIPGLKIELTTKEFIDQVNKIGLAVVGQAANLVPADKKLYALRDVTGTVESLPLISSSIMSKKLATGSDAILLDVKYGKGAFFEDLRKATELAKTMVEIGKGMGKDTRAILTNMNEPLGYAIGNILEIKEVIETLNNQGPKDLVELVVEAGSIMLQQARIVDSHENGVNLLKEKLTNGSAFKKFLEFVEAQGGDISYVLEPSKFPVAKNIIHLKSNDDGYINEIDAFILGEVSLLLGAGRLTIDSKIDYSAGMVLNKKVGDRVSKGEVLVTIHTNKDNYINCLEMLIKAFVIKKTKKKQTKIIRRIVE